MVWGCSCSNMTAMTVNQCTKQGSIKTWMREFGGELDWLAQSPDLNLLEHLWDELERRLQARPSHPTSASDLTSMLLEEWSHKHIPINTFLNLVESLPRGVKAVKAIGCAGVILNPMHLECEGR